MPKPADLSVTGLRQRHVPTPPAPVKPEGLPSRESLNRAAGPNPAQAQRRRVDAGFLSASRPPRRNVKTGSICAASSLGVHRFVFDAPRSARRLKAAVSEAV